MNTSKISFGVEKLYFVIRNFVEEMSFRPKRQKWDLDKEKKWCFVRKGIFGSQTVVGYEKNSVFLFRIKKWCLCRKTGVCVEKRWHFFSRVKQNVVLGQKLLFTVPKCCLGPNNGVSAERVKFGSRKGSGVENRCFGRKTLFGLKKWCLGGKNDVWVELWIFP